MFLMCISFRCRFSADDGERSECHSGYVIVPGSRWVFLTYFNRCTNDGQAVAMCFNEWENVQMYCEEPENFNCPVLSVIFYRAIHPGNSCGDVTRSRWPGISIVLRRVQFAIERKDTVSLLPGLNMMESRLRCSTMRPAGLCDSTVKYHYLTKTPLHYEAVA